MGGVEVAVEGLKDQASEGGITRFDAVLYSIHLTGRKWLERASDIHGLALTYNAELNDVP